MASGPLRLAVAAPTRVPVPLMPRDMFRSAVDAVEASRRYPVTT